MLRNYTRLINVVGGKPFFVLLLFLFTLPALYIACDILVFGGKVYSNFPLLDYQLVCAGSVFTLSQFPVRKRKHIKSKTN